MYQVWLLYKLLTISGIVKWLGTLTNTQTMNVILLNELYFNVACAKHRILRKKEDLVIHLHKFALYTYNNKKLKSI